MQSNWQSAFFRGIALDAWRHITTPEMTRVEADFLEHALKVKVGAHLLDVPCGNGRHCIELARRGYEMTGVDQSEEFISEARDAMPGPVRWVQRDMRSLPWASEFDGAYCWGNSFCYLPWDEAIAFLKTVARCLRPNALFIIDTGMAAESILPSLVRNRWFCLGDILMLTESRYDLLESRLDIDYTFVHSGQVDSRPTSSYLFTAGELCRMHKSAGLLPLEMFGSTNSEPYQIGSTRLILVSKRQCGLKDEASSSRDICDANANAAPAQVVRDELERILASPTFKNSVRLKAFLRYIVEQSLVGGSGKLKEHVLALELYNRNGDFDAGLDPIVRVDARRLRDKLREYYADAPDSPVNISLPKGGYVPSFEATGKPVRAALGMASVPDVDVKVPHHALPITDTGSWRHRVSGLR